jgi:hypothetical protein
MPSAGKVIWCRLMLVGVSQKNPIHLGAIKCRSLCGIRCRKKDCGRDVVWVQALTLICVQSGRWRNEWLAGSSWLSVADGCVCDAARRLVGRWKWQEAIVCRSWESIEGVMHIHKCHLQQSGRGQGGYDTSSKVAKCSLVQEWLQTDPVAVHSACPHENR